MKLFFVVTFFVVLVVIVTGTLDGFHEPLMDYVNFQVIHPEIPLSEKCANDFNEIRDGLLKNEIWALKIRDTSGKPAPNFINGNNFWLGREYDCNLINNPRQIPLTYTPTRRMFKNVTNIASKVPVEYRMIYASHTSKLQFDTEMFKFVGLHIGLCFPKICEEDEIAEMSKIIFASENWQNDPTLGTVAFAKSKNLNLRENFYREPFVLILIIIFAILTVLVTVGTILRCKFDQNNEPKKFEKPMNEKKMIINESVEKFRTSYDEKFWNGFSVQENLGQIFSSELPPDSLPSINGLRAIASVWLICGHIYFYSLSSIENIKLMFSYGDVLLLQPYYAALLAVEIFFVLGGFLLSYRFFEQQKKRPFKNLFSLTLKKISMRFIRIIPCFAVVLLMSVAAGIFINDTSQFILFEDLEGNCKRFWWRNLLLIHNFYSVDEMCMTWSWYVAADFQLFVLSSILLAISVKHKKLAAVLGGSIIAACSLYCGYLGVKHSFTFSLDNQYRTSNFLYTPAYTRVASYLSGLFAGYYVSSINRNWKITKETLNMGWFASSTVILFMSFMMKYGREDSLIVAVLFPAFGRLAWSLAVSFIVVATTTQFGNGPISKFWNAKVFIPLSRLSFIAYILNPVIIMMLIFSCQTAFYMNFYLMPVDNVGFFGIVNILAVVSTVLIFSPIGHLFNMIL